MAKTTIHCVRHAQGYHNLNLENEKIRDPLLTPLGKEQCTTLATAFPKTHPIRITHLVASPLRRTLYTALLSFHTSATAEHKLIALPELQETSRLPCDTGSSRAELEKEFGAGTEWAGKCDFALVTEDWNSNVGRWGVNSAALQKRAGDARRWLRELGQRGEGQQEIVVVTHGAFLHYLTQDFGGEEPGTTVGWKNTEYRSFEFVRERDEEARMVETEESRKRRGRGHPLSEIEQRRLQDAMEKQWIDNGFMDAAAEA